MQIQFTKMQGLGNDFVVIDARETPFALTTAQIQAMANRRYGVGFDQLLLIEQDSSGQADFRFRIFNADGGEAEQCGNGARCIALYIKERGLTTSSKISLNSLGGVLELTNHPDNKVTVKLGVPRFSPKDIPFLADQTAKDYTLELPGLAPLTFGVVNVGNPHAVIRVDEINSAEVVELGGLISRHASFPEGVNVGFMQVIDPQQIRLRVFERGSGETLACGSGACAAMVIGRRNGWLQERVMVSQPGGSLSIDWQGPESPIHMTGPAAMVFTGTWLI